MPYKERLDSLLNQPMSRRDFLRNIGLLAISIIGLKSALNILATGKAHDEVGPRQRQHDFGIGRFGV